MVDVDGDVAPRLDKNPQQDPVVAGPRHSRVSFMAVRAQGFVGFAGHCVFDGFATG